MKARRHWILSARRHIGFGSYPHRNPASSLPATLLGQGEPLQFPRRRVVTDVANGRQPSLVPNLVSDSVSWKLVEEFNGKRDEFG